MSKRNTRCSQLQLVIFFIASKKQEEDLNQQPIKRLQEDNVNPSIFVYGPLTPTLVNEALIENFEHSMQVIHESINKENRNSINRKV